jgi:uncharacterized heparinase superfamily protein
MVEGGFREAIARFHLHPSVEIDPERCCLMLPQGARVSWRATGGTWQIRPELWHPGFGVSEAAHGLEIRLDGPACTFELAWDPTLSFECGGSAC